MHHEITQPMDRRKPVGIFVCSLFEMFLPGMEWFRDVIFYTIKQCPQHRFYILTKFPQNIDRPMPDNVWLGVSITGPKDLWRADALRIKARAKLMFISMEPLLEQFTLADIETLKWIDWVILGRLTQHGKKYDPSCIYLTALAHALGYTNKTPIFMKDNLRSIWGSDLIQEMPEGK